MKSRQGRPLHLAVVAGCCCLLVACVSPYQATARPEVELVGLQAPVTSLAWGTGTDQLFGLTKDDRLVKIDHSSGETLDAVQLSPVGDNIALTTHPDELAHVAQPARDEIAVVETASMRHVRNLPGGEAPRWVAAHPSSHTLLALSEDSTTVTGVDAETRVVTLRERVDAAPDAEVVEGEDSTTPAFWVVSTGHATYFGGQPLTLAPLLATGLEPDTFSPNRDAAKTAYASLGAPGRVAAVELRDDGGPATIAAHELPDGIEHVESKAKEEFRVLLAGGGRLSVLAFDSLDPLATVEYGQVLAEAGLDDAPLAGVVVGDLYIYLPLEGEPYFLRIHKPSE